MNKKIRCKRHILISNKLLALFSGLSRKTKHEDGYFYEKHALGLADNFTSIKWSASLIKQMLAYSASCDSKGEITIISEAELAYTIGCSVRTVQNNNKLLEAHGILTWDRLFDNYIQVSLCDYLECFLDLHKKEEAAEQQASATSNQEDDFYENPEVLEKYTSKAGYTSISDEVIYLLFEVKQVNVLRLAARALYLFEKEVNVKKECEALISYSEIKHILPKYIAYKSAIRDMAKKLNNVFRIEVLEKADCVSTLVEEVKPKKSIIEKVQDGFVLSFDLVGAFNSKKHQELEKIYSEQALRNFSNSVKKHADLTLKPFELHSLVYQYGLSIVEKSMQVVEQEIENCFHSDVHVYTSLLQELKNDLATYIRKIAAGYYQAKFAA
ncbi:hypothetical protein AB1284_25435 [Bacillus sp. S2(2024)]|uniref:hypothetical protein n=1 Tax=Bacillus sp. S2(2024) TaxID=3162887 RepID=UPI003D2193D8